MTTSVAKTIDWLDGVKGACMLLVVVVHVSVWYAAAPLGETGWLDISNALTPLRMPTFFLVSGVLAQNAIDNDWPKARRRSLNLYFVYLLWTTMLVSLYLLAPVTRGSDPEPPLELLGVNAILPTYYWYIWALPVYYLLSVGARRLLGMSPWLLVLAALLSFFALDLATLFSSHSPVLERYEVPIAQTIQNFLWFYSGIVAKTWIVGTFDRARRRTLVLAFLAALAFVIVVRLASTGTTTSLASGSERFMQMLQAPGYMVMMLSTFVLLRATLLTRFFNWIGRGTLSVYIFHVALIPPMLLLLIELPVHRAPWLGWIVPIVLVLGISIACRLLGQLITKSPLRWMLDGPLHLAPLARTGAGSDTGEPSGDWTTAAR